FMGAHLKTVDGIEGCLFTLWAPAIKRASVVGDFNAWDGRCHPMRAMGSSGVWELFIPGLNADEYYKFELLNKNDELLLKTDPYARHMALRPETASKIAAPSTYPWQDTAWLASRATFDWQHQAISIYELHAGSWQRPADDQFYDWEALADRLIPYVSRLGYTHIELMPITEHPLDQSWGYQVTGFYAPSSRYGSPEQLRVFIDRCHQHNIGVILDWVPAHFPKDSFALARFNGNALYEHEDSRKGEHKEWGTLIFNYGLNEVRNFLLANALYWIEEFHIDGLRVDAVASMLYLDYSRESGEWLPNEWGGRENLEAVSFLQEMNHLVHTAQPGVITMAEESTTWPMVTKPSEMGGLGFSMKWNMGWMNDNLDYVENDPVHRKYHHNKLTFSQIYSYSENFVLPLSHDEVVHGKRSLYEKMPGDRWQKLANLRLFYAWQYAHPGKKLLFMGGEMAQPEEWNEMTQLNWHCAADNDRQGIGQLITDLNSLYRNETALHELDFSQDGFSWIDCNDSDQSVLALLRYDTAGNHLIALFNFTPVPRNNYRIGVPLANDYQEILNTDSAYYSGSNCGNAAIIPSHNVPWMNYQQSVVLTLPPLAALYLKVVK
ncbi:MAG: 1,4-alpha-glucan branching protein GlgB, partial [Leucothrix sp.]